MAWFSGKVSLGNFPDLAGAVNKLSESVKNIEKNFDSALGFEEKSESTTSATNNEASGLWPVMSFMGQKSEGSDDGSQRKTESPQKLSSVEESQVYPNENTTVVEEKITARTDNDDHYPENAEKKDDSSSDPNNAETETESQPVPVEPTESIVRNVETSDSVHDPLEKDVLVVDTNDNLKVLEAKQEAVSADQVEDGTAVHKELPDEVGIHERTGEEKAQEEKAQEEKATEESSPVKTGVLVDDQAEASSNIQLVGTNDVQAEAISDARAEAISDAREEAASDARAEAISNAREEATSDGRAEVTSDGRAEVTSDGRAEVTSDGPAEKASGAREEESGDAQTEASSDVQAEASCALQAEASCDVQAEASRDIEAEASSDSFSSRSSAKDTEVVSEFSLPTALPSADASSMIFESVSHENDVDVKEAREVKEEQNLSTVSIFSGSVDPTIELEKLKKEMKMMETALQSAARQAQAKADEIANMMNENENLRATIEELKRRSMDAEIESLREEYHQRVATLERKVYALTRERDTLRREQNKKSDAAALLKEKDEIIQQVMAEGEELSKKQAAQESTIRKLRAQIREIEEEKKGLMTKLQVEENKVESIKKDKMATEKLLQETIEKHQAELSTQKEFYTNALIAAKEAEALAEARANSEARTELESSIREAEERESMLVQTLEELRQTLSRKEQQAVFKEDMFRRDIEDLQKRYQASERRCEELISQVPDSTRPLLRQIEAMQETTARRAEAWAAVERSLNLRLQEAEAKAAAAEERERSVNERLSQTLSRVNVLEAQISCLRAEQTQLSRSLEKERQRAAENRQEYLAAKEEADTQEGRANQLEEEMKELRKKHKQELHESLMHREMLQQEIEKEKAARLDLERTPRVASTSVYDQSPLARSSSAFENGNFPRKLSTASSLGSMEESYFLQASLDTSDGFSERRNAGEASMSPYYMKSMTPSAFESALRQKEGELASYMSRLESLESIRDSLAEELVNLTAQCEKLRSESAQLPGIRAELEALRRRHAAALELMGERDEELEELRNDIVDLKEMYREQVNLLVNKIQIMSSSMGNA